MALFSELLLELIWTLECPFVLKDVGLKYRGKRIEELLGELGQKARLLRSKLKVNISLMSIFIRIEVSRLSHNDFSNDR